jgi:integrase
LLASEFEFFLLRLRSLDGIRCRDDNPAKLVAGPDRGATTEKQFLYPSEFVAFMLCDKVPIEWRLAVALAVYPYPRASELRVLRWTDVDLEHGSVHIHEARDRVTGHAKATRTGQARRFNIEPALLPLLVTMREKAKGAHVVALPSERDMARGLRRWLRKVEVKRDELHRSTPTRKALTFHDLRATGLTWMAVRGDDPLKIQQRAGHTDFATTQGYIRLAEAVREGFGEPFPVLPESLGESVGRGTRRSVFSDDEPERIVPGIVLSKAIYAES